MPSWKKLITSGSDAILNTVTASFFTGSFKGDGSQLTGVTATATIPNIYITTGSNTSDQSITGSLTITGSGLIVTGSVRATSFTGSFTGSLIGTSTTASFVAGAIFTSTNPALSSSYALTASFALNSSTVDTSSFVTTSSFNSYTSSINSFTSSINLYTQSLNSKTGSFITTGSSTSTQSITGSLIVSGSGLRVTGSITNTGHIIAASKIDTVNGYLYDDSVTPQLTIDWHSKQLLQTAATRTVDWGQGVLYNVLTGDSYYSIDWQNKILYAESNNKILDWSTDNSSYAGKPSTYTWRRDSTYPFSMAYDVRMGVDTESFEDTVVTTAGKWNIPEMNSGTAIPLLNAGSTYGHTVDLTSKTIIKIDYWLSDVEIKPGNTPTWIRIGNLEIYNDHNGTLNYSSSIKTDFGAVLDVTYSNTETQTHWTDSNKSEIYFTNNEPDPILVYLKYNIWAM